MRIRQQIETNSVQSGLNAANSQAQSVAQARFDAALLQAAQAVRDSDADGAMSPRMQQALATALGQLNQKSLPQLQVLTEQPQSLAALAANLGQADGLNPSETAQLNKLLVLALPKTLAHKAGDGVSTKTANATSTGGVNPGPQGGTPAALAFSSDFFGNGFTAATPAPVNASNLEQASGAFAQAVTGGLGKQGGQTALAGFAVPVSVNPAGAASQAGQGAVLANGQPIQNPSSGNGNGVSVAGQAGSQAEAAGANDAVAPSLSQVPDTELPVFLGLNVQIVDNSVPLQVQDGTQVTLKGDNSWVFPQGAATNVRNAGTPVPQGPAQTPTVALDAAAQPNASPGAGAVPGGAAPTTLAQASTVSPDQAPATEPVGDGVFAQDLQDAIQTAFTDLSTPDTAQSSQQASSAGQSLGNSQASASQQMLGQALNAGQTLQTNTPGQVLAARSLGALSGPGASLNGLTVQDGARANNLAQASSVNGALASLGQNGGQGFSGQQAMDGLVPKGVAQQISDAIDSAGGANPGRLVIRLNPADLGEVQVDLSMVGGKLTARLVTSQQDVRDVLVRDLAGFKAGLESHGVIVNEVSVAMRSGAGGTQQGSQGQDPQNWWRDVPQNAANTTATVPAGASAYAGNTSASLQGFSALA